jgi:threonine-phosphate decarboxylase
MTATGRAVHGGNLLQVAAEYGVEAASLLDFSANINPRGLPLGARLQLQRDAADAGLLAAYPDPGYTGLRGALAQRLGIAPECIVVGAGAEALIGSVLASVAPARCLVPIPAFSEYARACTSAEAKMETVSLDADSDFHLDGKAFLRKLRSARYDCVILNNPHNPSGALLGAGEMLELVAEARASGAFVLVDEAFIDYAPQASVVHDAVRQTRVAVVRSLTKFYGCPALRVGYVAGSAETMAKVARMVPTWPVTALAANALREALADEEYAASSLRENEVERRRLEAALTQLGAEVFPSAANFLLLRLQPGWPESRSLRESLIRDHHIVVRNCDSYAGLETGKFIRVAVRSAPENAQLLRALKEAFKETRR